jgi:hypothetical protein
MSFATLQEDRKEECKANITVARSTQFVRIVKDKGRIQAIFRIC